MLQYDIQPQFECENRTLKGMSKCDIRPLFQCQNRILNVEIRYSTSIRMSKKDFECQLRYSAPVQMSK